MEKRRIAVKGGFMPNHITNLISFGDQPEQVAAFHQMLRDLRQKDGVYGSIDFNKLIPMPKALDIESGTKTTNGLDAYRRFITGDKAGAEAFQKEHPEEWALGKQAYENIQQYGSPTWYEWCNKNWGTKWNAYSCVELSKDDDTMEFFTAWSSVPTILEALSRKCPDQTISYRWADEDIGSNVGEAVYKNGEMIDANIPEPGSREAYELASDIMGIDLADFDLYLSADKSTYEYHEDPPKTKRTKDGPAR